MSKADSGIIDKAEHERYVQKLQADFKFFLQELWKDRKLNRVAPLDRLELDIADWIQNGPKYRGVLAWRGAGKTYFGTAAFTAFRLRQDPDRKILIPSKTMKAMQEVTGLVRQWLHQVWFLKDLEPDRGRLDTSTAFDVALSKEHKQPSVKCIGNMGMLEGNRAHTILPDDIETKENTRTFNSREKLAYITSEYVNILYPDLDENSNDPDIIKPLFPSEVCCFGTVKHEDTLWVRLSKHGYKFRTWPICYPSEPEIRGSIGMAPMLLNDLAMGNAQVGEPTCPRRFGRKKIEELRTGQKDEAGNPTGGLPLSEWLMEYQMQTNLGEAMPYRLRISDLMVMDIDRNLAPATVIYGKETSGKSNAMDDIPCLGHGSERFYKPAWTDPRMIPYSGTKAFIDTAGRGEDKNGVAIISHYGGFYYVKCCVGIEGGYTEETMTRIAMLLRDHGAREVYIEDNFGGGMYAALFQPVLMRHYCRPGANALYPEGWACSIVDDKKVTHAWGLKEERIIEVLESITSHRRMIWDTKVAMNMDLQSQFTRIRPEKNCLGKSPNELDALAGCAKAWLHTFSIDPSKAYRKHGEQPEEEIRKLRDFLAGKGRIKKPRANWIRPVNNEA